MTAPKWFDEQTAGLALLQQWTDDLLRLGFSTVTAPQIEEVASRLVDLRLGGLARQLRRLTLLDWSDEASFRIIGASLAEMRMAVALHRQSVDSPLALQESLQAYLSGNQRKPDPQREALIRDQWRILEIQLDKEEGLRSRKIWLQGSRSGRFAYILDFAFGSAAFEGFYRRGDILECALCYYPSVWPYRAIWLQPVKVPAASHFVGQQQYLLDFLSRYSAVLADFPILFPVPLQLDQGVVRHREGVFWYIDTRDGQSCRLHMEESQAWNLVSASLSTPLRIFGEWHRGAWTPIALPDLAFELDLR